VDHEAFEITGVSIYGDTRCGVRIEGLGRRNSLHGPKLLPDGRRRSIGDTKKRRCVLDQHLKLERRERVDDAGCPQVLADLVPIEEWANGRVVLIRLDLRDSDSVERPLREFAELGARLR
jgi:hypothetical protein